MQLSWRSEIYECFVVARRIAPRPKSGLVSIRLARQALTSSLIPAPSTSKLGELCGKHHEQHPHFPLISHWHPARHNTAKMGFMDYLSDLYDSLTVQSVEAEEPQKDDSGE